MNTAHIHLIVNHLPLAGMIFSLPLLLAALWKNNKVLSQTALLAVFITGLSAGPTFLSGEPAEETIEHLPGVSEQLIKDHEEAAEKTIWVIGITAIAALAGFIVTRKKNTIPKQLLLTVTTLVLLTAGALAWTNNLGGQIRHPEIQDGQAAQQHD